MRVTIVDTQDSFVHNLAQALMTLGAEVCTVQSAETTAREILATRPDRLLLGPGPGHPADAGCLVDLVRLAAEQTPILGVCLGHQAIALAFGGRVVRHHRAVHGLAENIHHDRRGLFSELPMPVAMTRYHSLVVDPASLPACLSISAWADDGAVMALRHKMLPISGVQFHPESVLSGAAGIDLLASFIRPASPCAKFG